MRGIVLIVKCTPHFVNTVMPFQIRFIFADSRFGAVLALNYAIDFPQKAGSLVLIAPQYDMPKFLLKVQNVLFKFM